MPQAHYKTLVREWVIGSDCWQVTGLVSCILLEIILLLWQWFKIQWGEVVKLLLLPSRGKAKQSTWGSVLNSIVQSSKWAGLWYEFVTHKIHLWENSITLTDWIDHLLIWLVEDMAFWYCHWGATGESISPIAFFHNLELCGRAWVQSRNGVAFSFREATARNKWAWLYSIRIEIGCAVTWQLLTKFGKGKDIAIPHQCQYGI